MKLLVDSAGFLNPAALASRDATSVALTWIFIVFWLVVIGLIASRVFRRVHAHFGSSHWIPAQAVVESGFTATRYDTDVVQSHNNMAGFRLVLQYSYSVNGEYYSGYLLLKQLHRSREGAMDEFAQWKGRSLMIRYKPEQPKRSACLRQDGAPRDSISLGDQAPKSIDLVSLPLG